MTGPSRALLPLALTVVIAGGGCASDTDSPQLPAADQVAVEPSVTQTAASSRPRTYRMRQRAIESPAGPESAQPNLFATSDGQVYLTWLEKREDGHVLRLSTRSGDAWSEAGDIVARSDFFANWADFPSLAVLAGGQIYVHWLQKRAGGRFAYDVAYAVSSDGGATWSGGRKLNDDDTEAEHGFVTWIPLADGDVGVTWLDGRDMDFSGSGEDHDYGEMAVRFATLTPSGDVIASTILDSRACECCGTSGVSVDDEAVVFYRDRAEDEERNISRVGVGVGVGRELAASDPVAINEDGWIIAGCPVNGPAADYRDGVVAVAWYTVVEERGRVNVAFSSDRGVTFAPPIRVDDGETLGRVDLVLLDGATALVSWLEDGPESGTLRARQVSASGAREESMVVASISSARASGFARMARTDTGVVFAWTEVDDGSRVRTALLELE